MPCALVKDLLYRSGMSDCSNFWSGPFSPR